MGRLKLTFNPDDARRVLRQGIEKGRWTLQDLDTPPPGWLLNELDAKLIPGFTPPAYRNLLRDEPTTAERVEVVSPRDFAVVDATPNPVQRGSTPVLLGANGAVAESLSDAGVQGHEGRVGDEADHGDQAHLGAAWEGGAQGVGGFSDDW
jgi:hypothetical protein